MFLSFCTFYNRPYLFCISLKYLFITWTEILFIIIFKNSDFSILKNYFIISRATKKLFTNTIKFCQGNFFTPQTIYLLFTLLPSTVSQFSCSYSKAHLLSKFLNISWISYNQDLPFLPLYHFFPILFFRYTECFHFFFSTYVT